MKKASWVLCLTLFILPLCASAQNVKKRTIEYAKKDNQALMMDVYSTENCLSERKPCLLFVFGGGFYEGTRDSYHQTDYLHYMAQRGFVAIAIDYRLGLKGTKDPDHPELEALMRAVDMATEDLFEATKFILANADSLHIDKSRIVLTGSSAGAVTVLTGDHKMRTKGSKLLPDSFEYAGVIAFAGAIFSTDGNPKYTKKAPAPCLFFHGNRDKFVPYDAITVPNGGMFGSKALSKIFRENKYPYCFYTMEGFGHSVAVFPMSKYLSEIELFVNEFIFGAKNRLIDINLKDNDQPLDPKLDF